MARPSTGPECRLRLRSATSGPGGARGRGGSSGLIGEMRSTSGSYHAPHPHAPVVAGLTLSRAAVFSRVCAGESVDGTKGFGLWSRIRPTLETVATALLVAAVAS